VTTQHSAWHFNTGGAGRASLSLSPHGAGFTELERWRHDVGVPTPARDEHDAERALRTRLTLRRAVRTFVASARTFTLEELNYDADMLPSITHRMENASFQSLRRSLAAHQPAYWLEKRSNEHVDFCLMRRGGDDHGTPHVVCRIQAKHLGAKGVLRRRRCRTRRGAPACARRGGCTTAPTPWTPWCSTCRARET
jgi:hypothetical protein